MINSCSQVVRMDSFERDVALYQQELPRLLVHHEGKVILIKDAEIIGIFDSEKEAMSSGYERYQLSGFLVKEVLRSDYDMLLSNESCPT